jgi:cobalt-zinc-cadmium efflux system outer membrane protein
MQFRFWVGTCVLAAAASAQPVDPAQAWTEPAVLALFDQQTPLKREVRANTAAALEEIRGRTLRPNLTAAYSRETAGFTEFYTLEQPLATSGRLGLIRASLKPAETSLEAEGAARLWQERSLVRLAFYRVLAAQRQQEALDAAYHDLEEILRVLAVREREGEGSRYDRLRVERELRELKTDLTVTELRRQQDRAILLSYLPAQTVLVAVDGVLSPRTLTLNREQAIDRALEGRAEFRAESSRMARLQLEQQAAQRLRRWEPALTGGVKRTEVLPKVNDTGAVFGVSVMIPTANKGQTEVARWQAELDRSRARLDLLSQQVRALAGGAFDVYQARRQALAAYDRETATLTGDLIRIARVAYQEGEAGILELLDAYRVRRQTLLRRVELEAAAKESEIELTRVVGADLN